MNQDKKRPTAAPGVLRALVLALLLWAAGAALLAWGMVSGGTRLESAYPILCAWTVAVSLAGAAAACRLPGRPGALAAGALLAAVLGLAALVRWRSFGGHGVVLLLCAIAGGLLARILGGTGRKRSRRAPR